MVPNIIRLEGHKAIAEFCVRHTSFAPTHFMELLPNTIDKRTLQWIGNENVKIYWTSVSDFARQFVKAFQIPLKMPEHCPIQGPENLPVQKAMKQFVQSYDPTLNIRIVPLWVIGIIGIFNSKMWFAAHFLGYSGNHEDPFDAE